MKWTGSRFLWIALAATWLAAVSYGTTRLFRFSGTAGAQGAAPLTWPGEWSIRPAARGATLVVTLHPQCSCSRATIGELEKLMTRRQNGLTAYVLIAGEGRGALWKSAEAIPGVSVMSDPKAAMCARLGAMTSGQTYAFDSTGKLLFSGGITPARGHMGENAGVDALDSILLDQKPASTHSPVFGCPLTERPQ